MVNKPMKETHIERKIYSMAKTDSQCIFNLETGEEEEKRQLHSFNLSGFNSLCLELIKVDKQDTFQYSANKWVVRSLKPDSINILQESFRKDKAAIAASLSDFGCCLLFSAKRHVTIQKRAA